MDKIEYFIYTQYYALLNYFKSIVIDREELIDIEMSFMELDDFDDVVLVDIQNLFLGKVLHLAPKAC